jgi:oxaloacetate decarboxylase alpha subunit
VPTLESATAAAAPAAVLPATDNAGAEVYTVKVNGQSYVVEVEEGGDITSIQAPAATVAPVAAPTINANGEPLPAPLAGNVFKVNVSVGDTLYDGQVIAILEAMKMEVEVLSPHEGVVGSVSIAVGDTVAVGDTMLTFSQ